MDSNFQLLRSQRNDMFRWLREEGEEPREYDWLSGHVRSLDADVLAHMASGHYFALAPHDGWYYMERAPGETSRKNEGQTTDWSTVQLHFTRWLTFLRREVDAPDLWSSVLTQSEALEESRDPNENEPLSETERQGVVRRITAAKQLLLDAGLETNALAEANRKLDYLLEASGRMGRYDWRNAAIGVVVDIGIASAFDPQRAQELLNLLVGGVRHLLGG